MDKKKEKKITNLVNRIDAIDLEIRLALSKKSHSSAEINLAAKQAEKAKLTTELRALK